MLAVAVDPVAVAVPVVVPVEVEVAVAAILVAVDATVVDAHELADEEELGVAESLQFPAAYLTSVP